MVKYRNILELILTFVNIVTCAVYLQMEHGTSCSEGSVNPLSHRAALVWPVINELILDYILSLSSRVQLL